MNRTDRLHAIAEAIRRAGPSGVTAASLADDLEVSVRTIKRDVSALQQAGSPIWAQRGPGGGYAIDESASLPPVAFTPAQAVAISTAVAALPTDSPFAVDARTATRKLLDTLGESALLRSDSLAARVWLLTDDHDRATPGVVRAIEHALTTDTVLSITYEDAAGVPSKRRVEPIIAAWTEGAWYLVAHCRLRDDVRWFRFSRIRRANRTTERYQPRSPDQIGNPPPAARSAATG